MNKIFFKVVIFFIISFGIFDIQAFHPWYHGDDAYASLKMWFDCGHPTTFHNEDYIKDFPYYKEYVENIPLIDTSCIDFSTLPYPYNTLSGVLPYEPRGCYANHEYIVKLFTFNNIASALEIGSDYGLSTRDIATLLPEAGQLYAVDVWDFTNEGYYTNQRYIPFLSNVIHAGLTGKIIPVRKSSQDAIETFKLFRSSFDLIYVDGDHQTAGVLSDLELYFPLLSSHGVICGDDWLVKTVRVAVIQFAQKYQLTVYGACNFWFLKNEGAYQLKSFIDADDSAWVF